MRWVIAGTLVALLALSAFLAVWGYQAYVRPGPAPEPVALVVPKGSGVSAIAARLEAAGVVRDALYFTAAAYLTRSAQALKAGEYRFAAGESLKDALGRVRRGDTVVRRITVPEGLSVAQVMTLLEGAEGLAGALPEPPPEGSLLPETYHYSYADERTALLARMKRAMRRTLDELWPARAEGLPLASPEEAVVLASIVERETAVPEERARVAAVFVNRLRRGMRLQSDPTVVYALTRGARPLDRALLRKDLAVESSFNTYLVSGLPPHPIGNPGRATLEAVLHPAQSDELYFVADGSGGHAFASTLAEHNRNVRRWRRLQREQRSSQ